MAEAIRDNGGAYEKWEVRNGPPLGYVVVKLHAALEAGHDLVRNIQRFVPDELDHASAGDRRVPIKDTFLISPAHHAFYDTVKSYLALQNRLALMNEHDLVYRLMALSKEEFEEWLVEIESSSAV